MAGFQCHGQSTKGRLRHHRQGIFQIRQKELTTTLAVEFRVQELRMLCEVLLPALQLLDIHVIGEALSKVSERCVARHFFYSPNEQAKPTAVGGSA